MSAHLSCKFFEILKILRSGFRGGRAFSGNIRNHVFLLLLDDHRLRGCLLAPYSLCPGRGVRLCSRRYVSCQLENLLDRLFWREVHSLFIPSPLASFDYGLSKGSGLSYPLIKLLCECFDLWPFDGEVESILRGVRNLLLVLALKLLHLLFDSFSSLVGHTLLIHRLTLLWWQLVIVCLIQHPLENLFLRN